MTPSGTVGSAVAVGSRCWPEDAWERCRPSDEPDHSEAFVPVGLIGCSEHVSSGGRRTFHFGRFEGNVGPVVVAREKEPACTASCTIVCTTEFGRRLCAWTGFPPPCALAPLMEVGFESYVQPCSGRIGACCEGGGLAAVTFGLGAWGGEVTFDAGPLARCAALGEFM